jgi:hypothetical protein
MFGFFKSKKTIKELAESAEILPVAEDGDYKAFMVRVPEKTETFSSSLKALGGQSALEKFVVIIDNRITKRDFDDIFSATNQMHKDHGTEVKRNLNAERILICSDHSGYIFKWTP